MPPETSTALFTKMLSMNPHGYEESRQGSEEPKARDLYFGDGAHNVRMVSREAWCAMLTDRNPDELLKSRGVEVFQFLHELLHALLHVSLKPDYHTNFRRLLHEHLRSRLECLTITSVIQIVCGAHNVKMVSREAWFAMLTDRNLEELLKSRGVEVTIYIHHIYIRYITYIYIFIYIYIYTYDTYI